MAIRTFSAQDRYWEGGTETRKKVKKVRSIKVANLDRLRLTMRREKSRFNRGVMASLDYATDPSETSSAGISGTSSPNYMKATTSSSARKGLLQASSGNLQSSSAISSIDTRTSAKQDNSASSAKSTLKLNKVSVQECSDPAGVNIPVIVKQEKSLKRVPSLKQSKKLSSRKSMKIRAKYSQFQDLGISQTEMLDFGILGFQGNAEINGGMEIDPESSDVIASQGQDTMVKTGAQQRGILERSRSRKLTRLRSIRSSKARQRLQSRLSGGAPELMSHEAEALNAEPHYMKGTSSQELRKISDKSLTRTSSLRPLRILAKIPSLRSKKNKARKRPQATSLSGTSVNRATCSSTLKRTQFPDDIELELRGRELEGTSSSHVCPYSYCSIHGHRHRAPSQPVKEFNSAKRKLISNQKGGKTKSRSRGETEHHSTSATESDHLRQIVSAETYAVQKVMNTTTENTPEAEDDGIDFIIKVYAKPRKKWSAERTQSKDAEALHGCTYDQISVGDYEGKLAETQSETSVSEDTQGASNDDWKEKDEIFKQHPNSYIAALSLPPDPFHFSSRDSAVSPDGGLIDIFSNKQKYTSMWQLIHQQLLSSETSANEAQEAIQADEKIGGDGNTCREMSILDPKNECDNNLNDNVNDQFTAKEKLESHQTAAIKLVQDAINAILQSDAKSYHQQSNPAQGLVNNFLREHVSTPTASAEETFREDSEIDGKDTSSASAENKHKMKQIDNCSLQKEQDEREMPERQMSKSLSKLRKMFVTAKFIKAMERLKKINPRGPQYLSADPASENEKVNLRRLSMNEKKDTEEWMLDNALRQVISRLDPDQQRRVAQLVEAFETVTPEKEQERNSHHPVKSVRAPGSKLAIPMNREQKQSVEPEQDVSLSHEQVAQQKKGVQAFLKGVPEEKCFREAHEYQKITTDDKTPRELDETSMSNSTLAVPEKSSKSQCADSAFDDRGMREEEHTNTLNVAFQFPAKETEVSVASDMPTIFFNRQKYTSMWNMIYKHVVLSETSINENQRVNGFDEEHSETDNCQETSDKDSTLSDYSLDQNEDDDSQSAGCEKPELDQSAAIKLVKEALSAILKRHEQPTRLESIPDHYRAPDNDRDLYDSTATSCIEENSMKEGKRVENHSDLDIEDKLHHVKNTSLHQQVECGESKAPQRKMSKSLSKLKKAITTTRFIKAIERLTKSSPRKSQNPTSDTTSEEEKVYLRHRSMNGRKKGEEWMLDFALRQVISKMDPDQQRRVERLVEAFEKVQPGKKEGIRCHSFKEEAADEIGSNTSINQVERCYLKSQQQRSVPIEQVPQKQNSGSLSPTGDASLEISLEEQHDQQVSSAETTTGDVSHERSLQNYHDQPMNSADDIVLQETDNTAISDSTLESSENGPKIASVDIKLEEPNTGNETGRAAPTINSVVKPVDNMTTILFDKQKYTSMWNLIHHHVLSNEALTNEKKEVNEVDKDEQVNDSKTCQSIIDPDLTQRTQLKNSKVDEDNQSTAFDQSAAIDLVKEAINAILQSHEQGSDRKSLQHHGRAANKPGITSDTNALAYTKQDYRGMREEKQRNVAPEEKLQEVDVNSPLIQPQAEARESQRELSTSFSKLRKAIATAKFIKAMERLRKINPRKPRHLSAEAASEEERVYLRHLSINERKNDEEWMLDYALRKVLSTLAPDQQRKVALIVEAFETVHPEQKGIRHATKSEQDPAIETENMTDEKRILGSMSNDGNILPMHKDRLNMLGTVTTSKESEHKTEISSKISDSKDSNLQIHHQASLKGSPISTPLNISIAREVIDADHMQKPLQHAKDSEQVTETNITKGILCGKQKNTSMWHLIYQHVKSTSDAEAGSKLSERLNDEDQINRYGASTEIIADADSDDSDASSVTSELTETDATKLVREAINNILENELTSSKGTTVSEEGEIAAVEENTKKSISRGYSKLRKLIICNKFIKAMEKTRKVHPQKQNSPALNSDTGAGKVQLKTRAGEIKGMNEWMLDNVLQNVIAGLAPVQQKRVALLVEAFEKVHPDLDERGKGRPRCSKTELLDTSSSEVDAKEKEGTVSLTNSLFPDGFDLKLNRSTTSTGEVTTEGVPQEICKDGTPGLTKEYTLNEGKWISDGPCDITVAASDATRALSDTCKDPTEIDGANAPCVPLEQTTKSRYDAGALLEEGTSIDEQLVGKTEQASIIAKKPPKPADLKDEWNYSAHDDRSSEKSTSLWSLILQQVTTNMLEKTETPKGEIDAKAQRDSTQTLERRTDDSAQVSSKTRNRRDMGVQTPTSFEFQENEAIKVVEEAVEEILHLQDQINDSESMTSSTNFEQGAYSSGSEYVREPSPAATETVGVTTLIQSVLTPGEEKMPSKDNLPNSSSTFSKVILCKRFVKAMDKMRKLKAMSAQNPSQPPHTEEKGIPSLRQISTGDKTSWEEGMLDNALQKVIGNLTPAKKQRVALLVQAFETVGSQPEASNSWRGRALVS